ncbi:PQQ-dependent sugar dehydrogenase [Aldersonia sp. NBC_00410]|uniref:PQQ-dependent sugar dehydrogenase n=1 Tax=Aldersonia sp. NBC_00410 TaxID=2975954 RepID=UPI002254D464|nr:PQQ-dependent sugar dehydrogenase [Aldersonia sp. NBC_00410]MCX5046118.1 PQQ-dependent sugar dehydrogenase [Aldersonia sp. NBC_00410]
MRLGAAPRWRRVACAIALGSALLASGCARFDDSASTPFSPEPSFSNGAEVKPGEPTLPPTTTTPPRQATGPCIDPDPNVVATCLDSTSGLVVLPDGNSALVAERRTGRLLQVTQGQAPREIAALDVDASSDGGLLDIALSPTFIEDGLIYAYITTETDNRIVRIAPGDVPKDVLTGIPKGATGNRGALDFVARDQLVVITGDTGSPTAATDPASLAGKVLRVNSPMPGATPPPQITLSGIGTAGDVCTEAGGTIWVTDRTATEDRLQRIGADGVVSSPVWTWPDRPGVAGCAAGGDTVAVALNGGKALALVSVDPNNGSVTAAPSLIVQDRYGRLNGAAVGADGILWASTVNKDGGVPGPNDDRVIRIPIPQNGGGTD